jgi:hypothetical protein
LKANEVEYPVVSEEGEKPQNQNKNKDQKEKTFFPHFTDDISFGKLLGPFL